MKILVTGSHGLVGTALVERFLRQGETVVRLVRGTANRGDLAWDPLAERIDAAGLEGLDAVVHLAGENIAAGRWTPARKQAIRQSRVDATAFLSRTLAGLARPPRVLVSASAIGYYGDRGDEPLNENSPPGTGFLADVCRAWEDATAPAAAAGIRVVCMRLGVVLTPAGGALAKMLPIFRRGLGGRLGSGRQWMSWITLDDLVRVIRAALDSPDLTGPVNAVSPEPVRQAEFARLLAGVLHRSAWLPTPGWVLRLALGQMGRELLLASARVQPRRLRESGFSFQDDALEQALARLLPGENQ